MDVAIIDYKMSNLHSVQAACKKVGLSSIITSDPKQIQNAEVAILPGVGAFGEAMNHLTESRLDACINRFIESGRPFIGICLGLQLLFETSEEFGSHRGLGLIRGSVKKFLSNADKNTKYPVPQIGWNKIQQDHGSWNDTLLCKNRDKDFMYFVHSYYVVPEDEHITLSTTTYGSQKYCSSIQYKNIFASQFHPEKSGETGMKIYQQLKTNLDG
jgi:glutamine amidotransferase|tara:strand:- start:124 stop:765 length:642 start_codon:yes stop_codon:yes gene_type:complete